MTTKPTPITTTAEAFALLRRSSDDIVLLAARVERLESLLDRLLFWVLALTMALAAALVLYFVN
jgi:hypothetical protein